MYLTEHEQTMFHVSLLRNILILQFLQNRGCLSPFNIVWPSQLTLATYNTHNDKDFKTLFIVNDFEDTSICGWN